ncbi:putative PLAC8 motif-containing protein [Helianthus annuus]|uniref:PLAC8 motif-containing protein n=1 Tax=Helianthus annuus TaxID=4232 RepID=A0A251SV92_HELAN|nr:putative PLAC8 motif-containing protein [Helianthus annuus]KAJ0850686.1 putative PLAC8 motif-containing protein [Helianthus annuus]
MREDPNQPQIHQRNAAATQPEINHQSAVSSLAPPNVSNSNRMPPPMFLPNPGGIPPPYPRPPFMMGHESLLYQNQRHSWAIGLCDCFSDLKITFLVLLCPCVAFGKIAEIINEGETIWSEPGSLYCFLYIIHAGFMELVDLIWYHLSHNQCFGTMGYEGCVIGFFLATFYNGLYRTKMRRQWHLKGSLSSDYFLHLFCHHCALCQQYRQLEHQGFVVFQGWERNKERHRQAMATMYTQAPPTVQEMSR